MEQQLILSALPITQLKSIIAESVSEAFAEQNASTPKLKEDDSLLKIEEVCAILHVSKVTVHKWKRNGLIPFHRMGAKIYFKKSEVLAAVTKANNHFGGKS